MLPLRYFHTHSCWGPNRLHSQIARLNALVPNSPGRSHTPDQKNEKLLHGVVVYTRHTHTVRTQKLLVEMCIIFMYHLDWDTDTLSLQQNILFSPKVSLLVQRLLCNAIIQCWLSILFLLTYIDEYKLMMNNAEEKRLADHFSHVCCSWVINLWSNLVVDINNCLFVFIRELPLIKVNMCTIESLNLSNHPF